MALTADASLQVALASMMPDWELQALNDASDALDADGAAVALVDLGTTERGLEAARALAFGLRVPCVVLGDVEPPSDACARVVLRPFSLSELGDAVALAAEEGPPSVEPPAALLEQLRSEEEAEPPAESADAEVASAAEPEPVAAEPEPVALEPEPLALEPISVEPEPEPVVVEPEPEPVAVVELEAEPEPAVVEPEPEPVIAEEPEPVVVAEPEPVIAQE
ncbi:MAG: hypothetical protein LC663_00170, partial [Actinobacteria bacterium]|nr:hypothetical protein [Actinomycetota bacterium]